MGVKTLTVGEAQGRLAELIERIPLAEDACGVIHVAGTRVALDTLAEAFYEGATADGTDVYSVFGCILRRQTEVAACLDARAAHCKTIRSENESRFNPQGVRARLLSRQA